MTRWLPVHLTEFQAGAVVDALDMYVEGGLGQLTQREVRELRAVKKKVRSALGTHPSGRAS